jgi:uncharacterized protein
VNVEGERLLDAPREVVWSVVTSPAEMAELIPGVQSFEISDPTHWSAKVKIPLGLGALAMAIDFEMTDERELEFASLHAKGRGVGAMLNMQTSFTLEPAATGTRMLWTAEVSIAGPVASMGQRVLQPIVKQQVNHVLTALDKRVHAMNSTAEGVASPATA